MKLPPRALATGLFGAPEGPKIPVIWGLAAEPEAGWALKPTRTGFPWTERSSPAWKLTRTAVIVAGAVIRPGIEANGNTPVGTSRRSRSSGLGRAFSRLAGAGRGRRRNEAASRHAHRVQDSILNASL